MDTGSPLIWVQCEGCKDCFTQRSLRFDPLNSSTYCSLPCSHDSFDPRYVSQCNPDIAESCTYFIGYGDNTTSEGDIALQHLQLETPNDDTIVISDVVFGCGFRNRMNKNRKRDGIFGLENYLNGSILNKLGNRFSYCIGKVKDPSYNFNRWTIGDEVIFEGYSTPIEAGFPYYVTQKISFGEERLDIDPNAFKKKSDRGGLVFIDSGATLSALPEQVYNLVRKRVSDLLDGKFRQVVYTKNPWKLCYEGNASRNVHGFPDLTFHFANGADLLSDSGSLFFPVARNVFCLSRRPSRNGKPSLIGLMAQQYYNVGFDLQERQIFSNELTVSYWMIKSFSCRF